MTQTTKQWDFDEIIDRKGKSLKWDGFARNRETYEEGVISLSVADMDFRTAPPIIDVLQQQLNHGIFGYVNSPNGYKQAIMEWFSNRYNWKIDKKWILSTPTIINAVAVAIEEFSQPGDKIIVQQPVYGPLSAWATMNGRELINNKLKFEDGRYTMDIGDLMRKIHIPRVKILILCNPHNPVGRVWTKQELIQLGDICNRKGILVISDEIHCDITFPGHKYTPYAAISEEFAQNSIICTAPGKSFNLAGIHQSNIIIPNDRLRSCFQWNCVRKGLMGPNIFGPIATEAAYGKSGEWFDQVLEYIYQNYLFLKEFVREKIPCVKVVETEGTYLAWLDFRECGIPSIELADKLKSQGKVILNHGSEFGTSGIGFERICMACPRKTLQEGLERIASLFSVE